MVKVEETARRVARRFKLQDAIVITMYLGAAFSLSVAAPNTLRLLKKIDPDMARKRHPTRRISQAMSRLRSRGLIEKDRRGRGILTEAGKRYAEKLYSRDRLSILRPKRWDHRWRIVIFDVWERRRSVRDQLRWLLMKIGFVKVQNSVWAYPYDCEEVLAFIKADLRLGKGMLYLVAEGVEGDRWLRRHFKLPN